MSKKNKKYEPKKTINVSIQSKKYYNCINDILKEWDENDLQASTEVCESIVWFDKFNKSITLLNILNAYKTAEKMIELYSNGGNVEDLDKKLEIALSSAITIDINKLMDSIKEQCLNISFNTPIKKEETYKEQEEEICTSKNDDDIIYEDNIIEEPPQKEVFTDDYEEYDENDKYNISADFLFNS